MVARPRPARNFYPRPPRGGRRNHGQRVRGGNLFLSTPSAGRATRTDPSVDDGESDFYPRPPREGRLRGFAAALADFLISIHALRGEGDSLGIATIYYAEDFYPRPPRGGRRLLRQPETAHWYFYPRPPRGGRRHRWCGWTGWKAFLSTPSAGRATSAGHVQVGFAKICLSTPSAGRATPSLWPH